MKNVNLNPEVIIDRVMEDLSQRLIDLNQERANQLNAHISAAAENVIHAARYHFVSDHGPKYPAVSKHHPLVHQ